jgi:hypothetical protein
MNEPDVRTAVAQLNSEGYFKTNILSCLDSEGVNHFNNNMSFFEKMSKDPRIAKEIDTIQTNPQLRHQKTGGKPFEITHNEHLERALTLDDGAFIHFYLNDYFIQIAQKFLEVDNPYLFNVLAWMHAGSSGPARQHSQNWHRDREDYKLLKIFVYYSEVGDRNGPLQYVPRSFCGGDFHGLYKGRCGYWDYTSSPANTGHPINQQETDACESTHVSFTGKAGDIILANNSGFHRGGFVQEGVRVMSHALYLAPTAELIKNGYFSSFNYEPKTVNYIDFHGASFHALKDKQKHLKRP